MGCIDRSSIAGCWPDAKSPIMMIAAFVFAEDRRHHRGFASATELAQAFYHDEATSSGFRLGQ